MTLAVHVAGIQVRNGHRRRTNGSLTVHFGIVLGNGFRVAVAKEQAGNREAAVAFAFRNTGFLQQGQCAAARAEEHETAAEGQMVFMVFGVAGFEYPRAVRFAFDVFNMAVEFHFHAFFRADIAPFDRSSYRNQRPYLGGVVGGNGVGFHHDR